MFLKHSLICFVFFWWEGRPIYLPFSWPDSCDTATDPRPGSNHHLAGEPKQVCVCVCLGLCMCLYVKYVYIYNIIYYILYYIISYTLLYYILLHYIKYYIVLYCIILPVLPHKAVAEVSKIGNIQERLAVVNQGWQSESTDGPKGAWGLLSFSLFLWLSTYLPAYLLCIYLSLSLSLWSVYLSSCLPVYLSIYLSICLPVYLWCSVIQRSVV